MAYEHQHDPTATYPPGTHVWHYSSLREGDSYRIRILRHLGPDVTPYCVAVLDTRSNPRPRADADLMCAVLNGKVARDGLDSLTPDEHQDTP